MMSSHLNTHFHGIREEVGSKRVIFSVPVSHILSTREGMHYS